VSESLITNGSLRARGTPYVRVACLAVLTVAAAYALAATPALAVGQSLSRAPAAWLMAPLGARQAHQNALATAVSPRSERPAAHVLAIVPAQGAPAAAGALWAFAAPQVIAMFVAALLIAVALARAH
jgi:hypothetical protein